MKHKLYSVLGLSENLSDYEKNYEVILSAIRKCRENHFAGLRLPAGTFAIYNHKAVALYRSLLSGEISATNYARWYAERNIAFDIRDFDTFSVVGNHTQIILDGLIGAFDFTNVREVRLEGISVDWLNPPFFTAQVEKIEDHKITARTDRKLLGGEPIVSFQNFDQKTGKQKGMCVFADVSSVQRETDHCVTFTSADTCGLSVGDGIIARYIYSFAPVIHFYCCREVVVEDVTLYSGCGMGVIAHKCENLEFEKYRTILKKGRRMSVNTDAAHFISCYGKVHFHHCEFEGMGDDAVNIHGFYMNVKKIIDERTVLAEIEAAVQDGITDIPDIADQVEFSARNTLLPFAKGEIAFVEADENNPEMVIGFKEEFPKAVTVGCCIGNVSKTAHILVENCTVKNIRGRAMLIQTRNAIIRNNYFEGCTGQGVHIDTATGWWESIGTRNVEISWNRFMDCGHGMTKYCDAVGIVVEVEAEEIVAGVHKDIKINNNYIQGENTGIKVSGTDGLLLSENCFVGCKKEYEITCCKNVKIIREEDKYENQVRCDGYRGRYSRDLRRSFGCKKWSEGFSGSGSTGAWRK